MTEWSAPPKTNELTENRLITAILKGVFPINSNLPSERDLARQLGVTRPTLREALQRLAGSGWVEIRHGKSTRVRDFLREGNLTILNALARRPEFIDADFVRQLLEVRVQIAPAYTRLAFENHPEAFKALLPPPVTIPDEPQAFADADRRLHQKSALLSGNAIYPLLMNSFEELSLAAGLQYFSLPIARKTSLQFYQQLLTAAEQGSAQIIEEITRAMMQTSISIWQKSTGKTGGKHV